MKRILKMSLAFILCISLTGCSFFFKSNNIEGNYKVEYIKIDGQKQDLDFLWTIEINEDGTYVENTDGTTFKGSWVLVDNVLELTEDESKEVKTYTVRLNRIKTDNGIMEVSFKKTK